MKCVLWTFLVVACGSPSGAVVPLDGSADAGGDAEVPDDASGHDAPYVIDAAIDGGVDIAIPTGTCSASGWCWVNPAPQGNGLRAVSAVAPDDVWVAGLGGVALHHDGQAWRARAQGLSGRIDHLARVGTELWAAGSEGTFRFDGTSWARPAGAPSGPAAALVSAGAGDLWVASGTLVHHLAAGTWSQSAVPESPRALWAVSPTQAWAASSTGKLYRTVGGRWTMVASPVTTRLWTMWGASASDIWAAGDQLVRWNGTSWATWPSPCLIDRLWGNAANDVWGACFQGAVIHFDGTAWTIARPAPTEPLQFPIWSVGSSAANDVWVVGPVGRIVRFDGAGWEDVDRAVSRARITDVDGEFAVGDSATVLRRVQGVWTRLSTPFPPDRTLEAIWVRGLDDVWVGGDRLLAHFDGASWQVTNVPDHVTAIDGDASGAGWLATWGGRVARHGATGWVDLPAPGKTQLQGVWAGSPTNVWIVGRPDASNVTPACHWDGGVWACGSERLGDLQAIDGAGSTVYAVGTIVRRRQAGAWVDVPGVPDIGDFLAVRVFAHDDVIVAGTFGAAQFDGTAWSRLDLGGASSLWAIERDSAGTWIAGNGGAILLRPAS